MPPRESGTDRAYEIIGPGHHFIMWAYRGDSLEIVPDGFAGHHVSGIRQERWDRLHPHPTDMPILNDAGAAAYPPSLISDMLGRQRITMTSLITGETYGPILSAATGR